MNAFAPAFGCATGGMPFEDALERVPRLIAAPLACERIPLMCCAGRVLAEHFYARLDLPGFDQSAMDGYAVCSADVMPGMALPITGRTAAGEAPGRLSAAGAHRILTGAPLPDGADAVIAQENVHPAGDLVHIELVPPAGTNARRRGEDIRAGTELIATCTTLDWRHVTVMAAQGACEVEVRRRPRVALLSSGREPRGLGESLAPAQIHDSNMPMLAALLTAWGADVRPLSVVEDDASRMLAALRDAAEHSDLVLSTAGISVGDEDRVPDALQALGGNLAVLKVGGDRGHSRQGPATAAGSAEAARGGRRLRIAARASAHEAERLAGPMVGLTSLVSPGGIVEMTRRWGEAGNQISKTSTLLNTPVSRLSALRLDARLAGSSASASARFGCTCG